MNSADEVTQRELQESKWAAHATEQALSDMTAAWNGARTSGDQARAELEKLRARVESLEEEKRCDDLRLPLTLSANDSLRAKLREALDALAHFKERAEKAEAQLNVTVVQAAPRLEAMRARLETVRDGGGWVPRRWAKQMLGEA